MKPSIPDYEFTGTAGIPHDLAWDMWRALILWQIPGTVYMEQSPEYWQAMFAMQTVYGAAMIANKPPDIK